MNRLKYDIVHDYITCKFQYINDIDPFNEHDNTCLREPLIPIVYRLSIDRTIGRQIPKIIDILCAPHKSSDAILQIFLTETEEFSSILDSDLTLFEQAEELQLLQNDVQKNLIVLRQHPAMRVKYIIDKLTYMDGKDQIKAIFALKTIFLDDKDLVLEFVQNGGLDCLIKISKNSTYNNKPYVLRAIGQLMLYVDGMNGIIEHTETICWIYELLDCSELMVAKIALKLLIVFVEYTPSNALLLLGAISKVEKKKARDDWSSIIKILNQELKGDQEMLFLGMTIINKTLNGVPDQDTFYDVVDTLKKQGIEQLLQEMLKLDNFQLTTECHYYEHEIKKEDTAVENDLDINQNSNNDVVKLKSNNSEHKLNNEFEINKSKLNSNGNNLYNTLLTNNELHDRRGERLKRQKRLKNFLDSLNDFNKINFANNNNQENDLIKKTELNNIYDKSQNEIEKEQQNCIWNSHSNCNKSQNIDKMNEVDKITKELNENLKHHSNNMINSLKNVQSDSQNKNNIIENIYSNFNNKQILNDNFSNEKLLPITKNHIKLNAAQNGKDNKENMQIDEIGIEDDQQVKAPPPLMPTHIFSPTKKPEKEKIKQDKVLKITKVKQDSDNEETTKDFNNGFASLLQKRAKKFENSAFRRELIENSPSESEIKWKEAAENLKKKPMIINDLDFSPFLEFEQDPLVMVKSVQVDQKINYLGNVPPAPPLLPNAFNAPPPPPPAFNNASGRTSPLSNFQGKPANGLLKLHWKPAQAEAPPVPVLKKKGTFWNQVALTPRIDTSKISRLFEQKPKEIQMKKVNGDSKLQVLQVLSIKRSQAINIGLTKLPPIAVIPTAIRKFDASVLNKEGIEKILSTMIPSLEEVEKISEQKATNPDIPLGQAEQFLLSLSEIDCLLERLRLWLFMLDYQNLEKDIAESLMELNYAMKEIEESKTFRVAMGMLLTIGNDLNGTDLKAFQLDYLSRASEVKDPVHKYSLTHYLAEYMIDNYSEGTDLYSEFGAVSRSSRIDLDVVFDNLKKLEIDCKASFDNVAKISQRENNSSMKNKVNVFLYEVAERIHRLKHVHKTTLHRWNAFLLYFGYAPAEVKEQKPINVFKMVIEFALEYRTNRDKILQMRKRIAEKRERNKTRGMMIELAQAQVKNCLSVNNDLIAKQQRNLICEMTERHQEMSKLLTTKLNGDNTMYSRKKSIDQKTDRGYKKTDVLLKIENNFVDTQDDELLDGVVRTVTTQPTVSRDYSRRRRRVSDRKLSRATRTFDSQQFTAELMALNN